MPDKFTGSLMQSEKKFTKQQIVGFVVLFLLMAIAMWVFGYRDNTGLYPLSFLNKPESILPPKMDSQGQTYERVIAFLKSDDTDKIPYATGFNCVDATFRIWRKATWEGIRAYPIVIQYFEPPAHMVIAFPTKDRGDVFIEPQSDSQIRLMVGQNYDGRKVKGYYVLDYDPLPLGNSPGYDPNIKPE